MTSFYDALNVYGCMANATQCNHTIYEFLRLDYMLWSSTSNGIPLKIEDEKWEFQIHHNISITFFFQSVEF